MRSGLMAALRLEIKRTAMHILQLAQTSYKHHSTVHNWGRPAQLHLPIKELIDSQ